MLAVTVRFTVKPEFEAQFLERVRAQARASLDAEAGCRQFEVCRDARDRVKIFLYEIYTTGAAFDAHLQTTHFRAFDAATSAWIQEKVVECWERIEPA